MAAYRAGWPAVDARGESRDEVFHHASARPDGGAPFSLLIVNTSPSGLMARCDGGMAPGTALSVMLPVTGRVRATVRWALGGRIGCQFEQSIPPQFYYEMLAALRR